MFTNTANVNMNLKAGVSFLDKTPPANRKYFLSSQPLLASEKHLQCKCKYKLKRCSKKECCKQCRYVKFKGTMT